MATSRVLIVEDSRTFAAIVRSTVAAQLGFPTVVARSLADAKALLDGGDADFTAAVLDLLLPDSDGGEIVDLVTAHGIPVIVLTGTFTPQLRDRILSKSIVDYFVKTDPQCLDQAIAAIRRLHTNRRTAVLVVDDSRPMRTLIAGLLQALGLRVLTADCAEEGLAVLAANPGIRMVLTDYQMPGMDGCQLVSKIRETHSRTDLAVIGLSTEGTHSLSARFLKLGANDFLPKPFLREEFFCRVLQNLDILDYIESMREAAYRDFLTGLRNRKYFFEHCVAPHLAAHAGGASLAVAMLDVDHFKRVNDTYGHDGGDAALRHLAALLGEHLPEAHTVARFGGEEFCALVPAVDRAAATAVFERLRARVEASPAQHDGTPISFTISVGVALLPRASLDERVRRADELLYQAKASGRNRVVLEPE
ncbi:MAG TPA: diguanylate cyclase [Polyangia bacterium]|jgi:diguanylate cyclase (GGDEF)-like protein